MDSVWRRIESVITGLTRNFGRSWEFRPPDSPWYSSTQKISKSNIFCRLSCFLSNEFLSKFLERKPDENRHGELSEWSKVQHSKSWIHAGRLPMAIPWFSRLAGLLGLELNTLFSPAVLSNLRRFAVKIFMETYRSGHNGTDSKSVDPQGSVGSNPTLSATFG